MTYRLKLGEFLKIQEILNMMGTDFFQFEPLGAQIIGFKEGWGPKSLSGLTSKRIFQS